MYLLDNSSLAISLSLVAIFSFLAITNLLALSWSTSFFNSTKFFFRCALHFINLLFLAKAKYLAKMAESRASTVELNLSVKSLATSRVSRVCTRGRCITLDIYLLDSKLSCFIQSISDIILVTNPLLKL